MRAMTVEERLGKDLLPGVRHYRAYVGPTENYDLVAAMQFNLLTFLGLTENHYLLDVGCGSLRSGKLFIPYLLPGRYFGIEPNQWLIDEGIRNEVGRTLIDIKKPVFSNESNFTLSQFDQEFDFILAQSIFSHASQPQIRRCLSQAKKVMKPTSIFAATFVEGEEDYEGDEWVYPDCVTYTPDCINRLAEEQGFACILIDWLHPNTQKWVLFVHPEHESDMAELHNVTDLHRLRHELALCKERLQKSDVSGLTRLENELRICKRRLAKLERHPYVRLGLAASRIIRRLTR